MKPTAKYLFPMQVNCGKHANFKSHAELLLMIERFLVQFPAYLLHVLSLKMRIVYEHVLCSQEP